MIWKKYRLPTTNADFLQIIATMDMVKSNFRRIVPAKQHILRLASDIA